LVSVVPAFGVKIAELSAVVESLTWDEIWPKFEFMSGKYPSPYKPVL